MSLLSRTGLEEYARQCTLQRRRYEDCLQQAQQSDPSNGRQVFEDRQPGKPAEKGMQSCMAELLELPANLLDWGNESSGVDETQKAIADEQQWQDDRSQSSHQNVTNPTGKSANPVSYGAP